MHIIDSHFHWWPRSICDRFCKRMTYPRAEVNRRGGYTHLRQDGGELLLGVIGDAFRGRILAAAQPSRTALAFGAQHLAQEEGLKLLRGVVYLGWIARRGGSRKARTRYGIDIH